MPAKSERHLLEAAWIPTWQVLFRQRMKTPQQKSPKPKGKAREKYLLNCPCCGSQVYLLEQNALWHLQWQLQSAIDALKAQGNPTSSYFYYLNNDLFSWTQHPHPWREWVCDDCIATRRAEVANFEILFILNLHNYGQRRPYFYFDQTQTCITCQKPFVYSKSEQRWAHETYVIEVNARLKDCAACRKNQYHQQKLEATTRDVITQARAEPTFENLLKASQILLENTDPRAIEFLRRAKNKAPSLEQKQRLEQQIFEWNKFAITKLSEA